MSDFKHMMPDEALVWQRWLDLMKLPPDTDITYDVTVGEAVKLPEDFPEPYRGNAKFLSKKRIDAVITFPDYILIIEVKKVVSWAAIGQLMGYPILFQQEFAPTMPVYSLLVAESFPLDLRNIFDALHLQFNLVALNAHEIESNQEPEEPPAN